MPVICRCWDEPSKLLTSSNGHWVFWMACLVYYGVSVNLSKEGLVRVDGEYDFLRLAMGCGTVSASAV